MGHINQGYYIGKTPRKVSDQKFFLGPVETSSMSDCRKKILPRNLDFLKILLDLRPQNARSSPEICLRFHSKWFNNRCLRANYWPIDPILFRLVIYTCKVWGGVESKKCPTPPNSRFNGTPWLIGLRSEDIFRALQLWMSILASDPFLIS